jgi:hypothetical protein
MFTLPEGHGVVHIVYDGRERFAHVWTHGPAYWEEGCACLSERAVSVKCGIWGLEMSLQVPL